MYMSVFFFKIPIKEKTVSLFEINVYSSYSCVMKLPRQSCVYHIIWLKQVSEYDQAISQSHTAHQPRHREEEPQNNNVHKTKHQDDTQGKATGALSSL